MCRAEISAWRISCNEPLVGYTFVRDCAVLVRLPITEVKKIHIIEFHKILPHPERLESQSGCVSYTVLSL